MSRSSFYATEGPGTSDLELLDWYLAEMQRIYDLALDCKAEIEALCAAAQASADSASGYADDAAASAALALTYANQAESWYNDILNVVSGGEFGYTPAVLADWNGSVDPGDMSDAMDQVAARIKDLETGTTAIGYTPATLASWTDNVDPGNVNDALDQLAARVTTATQEHIIVACSDESTAITAGTQKATFRIPYNFTLSGIRASLATAQTSGSIFTVDVNQNGVSILSTKITIDNAEKTSTSAATPCVISDLTLDDDSEITFDVDQVGDGTAKGLKVTLIGFRTLGG